MGKNTLNELFIVWGFHAFLDVLVSFFKDGKCYLRSKEKDVKEPDVDGCFRRFGMKAHVGD